MKWSWRLGQLAGIGVYMHWTFLLLLPWIVVISIGRGAGVWGAAGSVAFILAVFACIVLHELGHALPVLHGDPLVGLLSLQNIGELMMIRSALRREGLPQHAKELVTASRVHQVGARDSWSGIQCRLS